MNEVTAEKRKTASIDQSSAPLVKMPALGLTGGILVIKNSAQSRFDPEIPISAISTGLTFLYRKMSVIYHCKSIEEQRPCLATLCVRKAEKVGQTSDLVSVSK